MNISRNRIIEIAGIFFGCLAGMYGVVALLEWHIPGWFHNPLITDIVNTRVGLLVGISMGALLFFGAFRMADRWWFPVSFALLCLGVKLMTQGAGLLVGDIWSPKWFHLGQAFGFLVVTLACLASLIRKCLQRQSPNVPVHAPPRSHRSHWFDGS